MVSHPNPHEGEDIPESIILPQFRKYCRISELVAWGFIPKKIAIFSLSTSVVVVAVAGMVVVVVISLLLLLGTLRPVNCTMQSTSKRP